jgi:hypothetical protein
MLTGRANRALDEHLPHTHAGAHSGLIDGSTNTNDQINQSIPAPEPASLTLLAAVKVSAKEAKPLAVKFPLATIRECVAAWWMNRKSVGGKLDDTSSGIVVYWLKECAGVPSNGYDVAAWRRTDLYRQHRTQDELDDERAAEAEEAAILTARHNAPPVLAREPVDDPPSPYLDDDPIWQELVCHGQAGELAGLVRMDTVDGVPLYVLAARDPLRVQWLNARMASKIRHQVAATVRHPVLVEIVPPLVAGG